MRKGKREHSGKETFGARSTMTGRRLGWRCKIFAATSWRFAKSWVSLKGGSSAIFKKERGLRARREVSKLGTRDPNMDFLHSLSIYKGKTIYFFKKKKFFWEGAWSVKDSPPTSISTFFLRMDSIASWKRKHIHDPYVAMRISSNGTSIHPLWYSSTDCNQVHLLNNTKLVKITWKWNSVTNRREMEWTPGEFQ